MGEIKLNKDDVINLVIVQAQKEFSEHEQHYIQITRLNKLITLVVEDLSNQDYQVEDFIWGYYRHGFYSKTANNYLKDNFGDNFNLSEINAMDAELPENVTETVSEYIHGIKKIFLKSREEFYDWVYKNKTPSKYRDFYQTHRKLEKWFENMKIAGDIIEFNANNDIFDIISDYYYSLEHVEDPGTIEIFGRFADILEQLSLKLKYDDNSSRINIELDRLHVLYRNKIYNTLTPYLETVKGDDAIIDAELESHKKRMFHLKTGLNRELKSLQRELESKEMFPLMEDLHEEIMLTASRLPENSRSIKEIYQDMG